MDFLTPTIPWIRSLQSQDWLLSPMKAFTFTGNEEFFLLLLPVIYWLVDRKMGARIGVLLLVSVCLNDILKLAFHLPRPYWDGSVEQWATETTFGFPSGHAQNAMLLWPFLALYARKNRGFWLGAALVLVGLISLSRVYLGAHFPVDILGGIVIGTLLLLLFVSNEKRLAQRWNALKLSDKLWISFAFAGFLAVVRAVVTSQFSFEPDASIYARTLGAALSGQTFWGALGALFGLSWGLALVPKWNAFGLLPQKLGRFALGFLGLFIFYFALKRILPDETIFRVARYFLTTFWVAWGAPFLFLKLRLADRENISESTEMPAPQPIR